MWQLLTLFLGLPIMGGLYAFLGSGGYVLCGIANAVQIFVVVLVTLLITGTGLSAYGSKP